MNNAWFKRAVLGALLVATTALAGCYVYPYGPRYVYGPVYHPYYYR